MFIFNNLFILFSYLSARINDLFLNISSFNFDFLVNKSICFFYSVI